MSVSKSDILKEISRSYPNLLKKDLLKFIDVFLDEIRTALKKGERVELRGWGVFFAKKQIPACSDVIIFERKQVLINQLFFGHIFVEISHTS